MHRVNLVGVFALGIAASQALGTTITTADGNGADTFIYKSSPDQGFGSDTSFAVKQSSATVSASTDRIGFLRFDTTGISGTVSAATLTLHITGGGTTQTAGNPMTFTVLGIPESLTYGSPAISLENFIEGTSGTNETSSNVLTFNDAPGHSSSIPGSFDTSSYTNLGQFVSSASSGQIDFSSAALTSFLNSDTNHLVSFVIVRNTADANVTGFWSKEKGDLSLAPALNFTTTPEPSSLALAAMGGVALLRRRRGAGSQSR